MRQPPNPNRSAPLIEDLMNAYFGDIAWAICYPDGSHAIGLRILPTVDEVHREMYGRILAAKRAELITDITGLKFSVLQHGWMKPRGIAKACPVVVFKVADEVRYAQP